MTRVFTARNPTEAHLLQGALENKGIPSEVRREALFGASGEVPFMDAAPEVWVLDDSKVAEALEVLQQRTATNSNESDESWRCSNCGELVEPQLTTCWQCDSDR